MLAASTMAGEAIGPIIAAAREQTHPRALSLRLGASGRGAVNFAMRGRR
jgi:hypothetical protein